MSIPNIFYNSLLLRGCHALANCLLRQKRVFVYETLLQDNERFSTARHSNFRSLPHFTRGKGTVSKNPTLARTRFRLRNGVVRRRAFFDGAPLKFSLPATFYARRGATPCQNFAIFRKKRSKMHKKHIKNASKTARFCPFFNSFLTNRIKSATLYPILKKAVFK